MGFPKFSGRSEKTGAFGAEAEKRDTIPADSNEAAREGTVFVNDVDGQKGGTGAGNFLKGDYERELSLFDKKASLINAYVFRSMHGTCGI